MKQQFILTLYNDQALVLFDFLSRFNKVEHKEDFKDQLEEKVLSEIEVQLEKILSESFFDRYQTVLQDARSRARDME